MLGAGLAVTPPLLPPPSGVQALSVRLAGDAGDSPLGDGTAFVIGPSSFPIPSQRYVDAADALYLQPRGFTGTAQPLFTPVGDYPGTGVKSLEFDPAVAQGQQILDGAIQHQIAGGHVAADNPVVVFGWSVTPTCPMAALYDLLEPDMRILVDLGYGSITDGWNPGPATTPTTFGLFPTGLNAADVLTALSDGLQHGVTDAVKDLQNPDTFHPAPIVDNPALTELIQAAFIMGIIDSAHPTLSHTRAS